MEHHIKIIYHPEHFIFKWQWTVPDVKSGMSMRNPWREYSLFYCYGFGDCLTRKRAIRAAKQWIRQYQKDQKKYGPDHSSQTENLKVEV